MKNDTIDGNPMTLCSVCRTNEATQEHHLSHEPELTIDICVECHNKVHPTHGVGRARGHKILNKDDDIEIDEWIPLEGTFTWVDTSTEPSIIKSKITYEELHHLRCPNAAKSHMLPDGRGSCKNVDWIMYGEPSSKRIYLRCTGCGYDTEIKITHTP